MLSPGVTVVLVLVTLSKNTTSNKPVGVKVGITAAIGSATKPPLALEPPHTTRNNASCRKGLFDLVDGRIRCLSGDRCDSERHNDELCKHRVQH